MTPAGVRGFPTAASAKADAFGRAEMSSFAIIKQPGRQEFAWVAPLEFFMTRMQRAMMAGIEVIEWGHR